jgi:hypothetical protein
MRLLSPQPEAERQRRSQSNQNVWPDATEPRIQQRTNATPVDVFS